MTIMALVMAVIMIIIQIILIIILIAMTVAAVADLERVGQAPEQRRRQRLVGEQNDLRHCDVDSEELVHVGGSQGGHVVARDQLQGYVHDGLLVVLLE